MLSQIYQKPETLTLVLTLSHCQAQTDGWVGVLLKDLLLVKLNTKYESNPSSGSGVIKAYYQ